MNTVREPQRRSRTILLTLLLIALMGGIGPTVASILVLDGPSVWVYPEILGWDTEFAPRYTHLGFIRLKVGMTAAEVLDSVGEPFARKQIPAGGEVWSYSRPEGRCRTRLLGFKDGRLDGMSTKTQALK